MHHPDTEQHTEREATNTADQPSGQYGGIRRLAYFAIMTALLAAYVVLITWTSPTSPSNPAGASGTDKWEWFGMPLSQWARFAFAVQVIPVYLRLKNIGMNPWWCLLALVPLLNLFVAIRCLVFQEGYVETEQLDKVGKVITASFFGVVIGGPLLAWAAVLLA